MRDRIISVCFDAAAEAANCFGIRIKLQLGVAYQQQPIEGEDIARREAECLCLPRPRTKSVLGI